MKMFIGLLFFWLYSWDGNCSAEKSAPFELKLKKGDYGIEAVLPDDMNFKKYINEFLPGDNSVDSGGEKAKPIRNKSTTLSDVEYLLLLNKITELQAKIDAVRVVVVEGKTEMTPAQFIEWINGDEKMDKLEQEKKKLGFRPPCICLRLTKSLDDSVLVHQSGQSPVLLLNASQYDRLKESVAARVGRQFHLYTVMLQLCMLTVIAVLIMATVFCFLRYRRRSLYTVQ